MNNYNFLKPSNKLEIIVDNKNYFCTIYYVENDKITVFFDSETILPEKEIEINIYSQDGVYNATSRILSSNYLNDTTFYMLSFPSNIKHSQRREFLRANIEADFSMRIFLDGVEIEKVISTTQNICAKGLAFIADRQMTAYSKLIINLFIAGKEIETEAQLVYSTPIRVNNSFKFLTAVTFTTVTKEQMNFLTLQCMKFEG